MISPDYFKTLNQSFLAGRDFTDLDRKKSPRVAIVNQKFAEQYFAGLNPVGHHFKVVDTDTEIVGMVKNSRYQALRENTWPLVYLPIKQTQSSGYTLLVRMRSELGESLADIETTIHSAYPRLPIYDAGELREQIDQNISAERVLSFLSTLFSLLVTLLCCVGIYGLMAYAVTRRTREIGVRIAIGGAKDRCCAIVLARKRHATGCGDCNWRSARGLIGTRADRHSVRSFTGGSGDAGSYGFDFSSSGAAGNRAAGCESIAGRAIKSTPLRVTEACYSRFEVLNLGRRATPMGSLFR